MKLTNRELAVMRILCEADRSLMVSEIVQKDKNGTIYSVQRIVQNLIKKNMVAIDGIAYNKKALGRTFKPLVSIESIEINAIQEIFSGLANKNIAASHLIAALLPTDNDDKTLEELNQLEEIIRARKTQLLQNQRQASDKPDEK
ncbi:MAG: BlaI/MecI/CopY family transcriptional regulator [Clostridium sp.]|nr:BlaI/MecI/CopY family transcriptional regulator [Clostridium sp.]